MPHLIPVLLRTLLVLTVVLMATPTLAANYLVNNTGSAPDAADDTFCDTNPAPGNQNVCTLAAAIGQANRVTGPPHNITFAAAITAITLTQGLPSITAPVTINGVNAGAVGQRVDINGGGLSGSFDFSSASTIPNPNGAQGSTIMNLVIRNFNDDGISLSGHNYTVTNCYIGITPDGESASPNSDDGISVSGVKPRLPAIPNLPGGFDFDPAQIAAQLITLFSSIPPNTIANNLISGNKGDGIEIFGQNTALNWVTLNRIGTDKDGTDSIPNGNAGGGQHAGVRINSTAYANIIGPLNLISGNSKIDSDDGVDVDTGTVLFPNFIVGNAIGIGASPAADVGNGGSGIVTDTRPEEDGTQPDNPTNYSLFIVGNVISDNKGANNNNDPDNGNGPNAGISITSASRRVKVITNFIGLGKFGPTAELSLDYGNAGEGIFISTPDHEIGGSTEAEFNVITGNKRHGILVAGSNTHSVLIRNNFIGVPDPTMLNVLNLGNAFDGIHIHSASTNSIGGPGSFDDNVIAGNGRNGVALRNGSSGNGWSNLITRNQIYGNAKNGTGVGIDLEHDLNIADVQPDPAGDDPNTNYSNYGQNQPIVCTGLAGGPAACVGAPPPVYNGVNTTLHWTLDTRPNATVVVEFFSTTATAQTYLGNQTITTNASGLPNSGGCTAAGRCTSTIGAGVVTNGKQILLTATDITNLPDIPPIGDAAPGAANNTSEFSLPVTVLKPGELRFSIGAYTVNEAGPVATITVQRVNGAEGAVSVQYATSNGTAVQPGDYGSAAGTLTWANGDSASKTFTVSIVNDLLDESNETVQLALSNPTGGAKLVAPSIATLTIQDNDSAALSINNVTKSEGNSGASNFTFTVTLSNPSVVNVTVNYATANGSAVAPGDYTAIPATVLTFTPGQTSKTVTVIVKGDTTIEPNETFTVNLSGAVGATIADGQGLGTIQNDDVPTLTINNVTKAEGNSGTSAFTFTVTLTPASTGAVTVKYATANGTATAGTDYAAIPATLLTFSAGQTSKAVTVNVTGDTTIEPNETFTVNLSGAVGATIADGQGLGTIQNDDARTLKINDVQKGEGNSGTSTVIFTVTLTPASASTVTVNYATANGTATAGTDYTAIPATPLMFTAGQTSKTVTVNVVGNTTVEPNETFFVNLSAPSGATIADGQGLGTILNDDGPTLRINDVSKAEGNSGTSTAIFTVTLTPASAGTVTVNYATANGTATAGTDYTAIPATPLTFTPGQTSKLVTVVVKGDTTLEPNETFVVNLSGATGATLFDGQGLGTILNDEGPTFKINDVTKAEGNSGTSAFTFTVTLTPASAGTVTVNYATVNGTATAGTDYTAIPATPLTFTAGQTSKLVTVNVTGDATLEPNETFVVNLSGSSGPTLFDGQGVGTILNDEGPTLRISDISLAEGNSGVKAFTFTVTLTPASTGAVTVKYATANGTATAGTDYAAIPATLLTFSAGQTSKAVTVNVTGDTTIEPNETFTVNLSGSSGPTLFDGQGVGTISNDDG